MKQIIFLILLLACMSCGRKLKASQSIVENESVTTVDTSTIVTELVIESETRTGDTLQVSLYFPKSELPVSDSVESSGLKVKVLLEPAPGGHKVSIDAIAKPVSNTTKSTLKTHSKAGLTETTTLVSELSASDEKYDPGGRYWLGLGSGIVVSLMFLVVLIVIIWRVARK